MKKILSMILAIVMVLGLSTTAFAAMEGEFADGKITITNAVDKEEYKAYQILYIESYNSATDKYTYKANSEWVDWLATQTDYVAIDEQGYVTWVSKLTCTNSEENHNHDDEECYTPADVVAFAKLAQIEAAKKTADVSATASDTGVVEFTELKLGYYLVDTTLGTLCSLDTTNPTVEMEEKNTPPSIVKEVKEDSLNSFGENDDAEIGQVVEFKTTINITTGAYNYVVHDRMTEGLTFNNDVMVKINGETETELFKVNAEECTCDWDDETEGTQGCTFTVKFDQALLDTLETGDTLVVYYSATVNEKAEIYPVANVNTTDLTYGNEGRTEEDFTETFVYKFDLIKVDGETKEMITGAEFELYYAGEGDSADEAVLGDKINLVKDGEVYRFAVEKDDDSAFETIKAGEAVVTGLDGDNTVYYLVETKQPDGYNKLKNPVRIVMTDSNKSNPETYEYSPEKEEEYAGIIVYNQKGVELPSTGGTGTTVFYVLGSIMTLGALVILVARKRMGEAE